MSQVKPTKELDLNPVTGELELVSGNNFSYRGVPADKRLKIPENMQMAIFGEFTLEGDLYVEGEFVVEA